MDLVPGFQELLQGLSPALTAPSFASLCTIITGWLFSGRGIVTRMIVADSAYGGQNVRAKLPGNCDLTSRLLPAARLYDARPERVPGTNGRGSRNLARLLEHAVAMAS